LNVHRDFEIISRAWQRFVDNGELFGGISPLILRSWIRSKNNQVSRCQSVENLYYLNNDKLEDLQRAYKDLREAAGITVTRLKESLYNHDLAVLLSDPEGNILDVFHTRDGSDALKGFRPGLTLAENLAGTNCIGLSALDKDQVSVWGAEHYNSLWHRLFGEAAPIITKEGDLKGIIALIGNIADKQTSFNNIVYLSALSIEDQLEIWEYKKMTDLEKSVFGVTKKVAFSDLRGEDRKWKDIIKLAKRASEGEGNLYITGAKGTGKESLARAIHFQNSNSPFITYDCEKHNNDNLLLIKALEMSQKGALYLKNVNYLTKKEQSTLLKASKQKTFVDVYGKTKERKFRFFASSIVNMEKMVNERLFDQDLYYRLSGHHILIPPLQERIGDLECLVNYRLETLIGTKKSTMLEVTDEAWTKLKNHSWPGNVTELFWTLDQALEKIEGNTVIDGKHILVGGSEK